MANNDILVQSSLQTLQSKVKTKQQDASTAVPAKVVPGQVKSQEASEPANLEKLRGQQAERLDALRDKLTELNDHMQNLSRNLQFSVDDDSGETVIKVVDSVTDELIRQIPSQEVLDARDAVNKYRGLLLETKA